MQKISCIAYLLCWLLAGCNGSSENDPAGSNTDVGPPDGKTPDYDMCWSGKEGIACMRFGEDEVQVQHAFSPNYVAVDTVENKMYWTDGAGEAIWRANLDGQSQERIIAEQGGHPHGLAIANGKLYWTNSMTGQIRRAQLDGSSVEDILSQLNDSPRGLAVADGKLYWVATNGDKIRRANLDGSSVEDLVTDLDGQPVLFGLAVVDEKLYWAATNARQIQRSNLDGSSLETVVTGLEPSPELAMSHDTLYWVGTHANSIQLSHFDGSSTVDLFTGELQHIENLVVDDALYFSAESPNGGAAVRRAQLDGSDIEEIWNSSVQDVAVFEGELYLSYPYSGKPRVWLIVRANLDGSHPEIIVEETETQVISALTVGNGKVCWERLPVDSSIPPQLRCSDLTGGVAQEIASARVDDLVISRNKLYWSNKFKDEIGRMNLDGSDNQIVTHTRSPVHLALPR